MWIELIGDGIDNLMYGDGDARERFFQPFQVKLTLQQMILHGVEVVSVRSTSCMKSSKCKRQEHADR